MWQSHNIDPKLSQSRWGCFLAELVVGCWARDRQIKLNQAGAQELLEEDLLEEDLLEQNRLAVTADQIELHHGRVDIHGGG